MKKILVLGPILHQWSEIEFIKNSLAFLSANQYTVDYIDPLCYMAEKDHFFIEWQKEILSKLRHYDVFIGFSLGGVVLQQYLGLFKQTNKSLILFSVPSFINEALASKLNTILDLLKYKSVYEAIHEKNKYVFFPDQSPYGSIEVNNPKDSALRLEYGLNLILNTNARSIITDNKFNYLHFIGEKSFLVNKDNVITSRESLHIVPNASMRILQSNPLYCIDRILNFMEKTV